MTVSVLLRLVPESLRTGTITGEVELVETGERAIVRDATELVDFLRQTQTTVEPRGTSVEGRFVDGAWEG